MISEMLKLEKSENGIYKLILNHPPTKNAMNEEMAAEFFKTIQDLKKDSRLRVLILTGEGETFSAGGNLDMLFAKTKISEKQNEKLMLEFYQSFLIITELNVPVIAAINGHAVGAGLCLSLACDLRIVLDSAKLGLNFVLLGLHPGMAATYFLPRLVGPAKTAELLFSGKILNAEEAIKIGLISQIANKDNFWTVVKNTAEQLLAAGPQAVSLLKESLRINAQADLKTCLSREAKSQAKSYASEEFLERITAAKRK